MVGYAEKIVMLLGGQDKNEFRNDLRTNEAITSLTIKFGEAATVLMQDFPDLVEEFPFLPLTSARRMRNRLIHGYWDIDLGVVHETAIVDMPIVIPQLLDVIGIIRQRESGR